MEFVSLFKATISLGLICMLILWCLYLARRYRSKIFTMLPSAMRISAERIKIEVAKQLDMRNKVCVVTIEATRYTILLGAAGTLLLDKTPIKEKEL